MDRCRCEEYAAAVNKLKFYTVGTLRPDIIANHDRSGYDVRWVRHSVDFEDLNFVKPKVFKIQDDDQTPKTPSTIERRRIEQMWCPYMRILKK